MAVIQLNPRTPGQRFMQVADFKVLSRKPPEKRLLAPIRSSGGRNNTGHMTSRHRGGGHKRRLRIIDFKRNRDGIPAVVAAIEYDPNRSANIALLNYADGDKRYILAPEGLKVGDTVQCGAQADIKPGNALQLKDIPVGTIVHAVELRPGKGAQLARGAAPKLSSWLRRASSPYLNCPRENKGWCLRNAGQLLVKSVMSIMRTSPSAKRAVAAGWASVPTCAELQ